MTINLYQTETETANKNNLTLKSQLLQIISIESFSAISLHLYNLQSKRPKTTNFLQFNLWNFVPLLINGNFSRSLFPQLFLMAFLVNVLFPYFFEYNFLCVLLSFCNLNHKFSFT